MGISHTAKEVRIGEHDYASRPLDGIVQMRVFMPVGGHLIRRQTSYFVYFRVLFWVRRSSCILGVSGTSWGITTEKYSKNYTRCHKIH